MPSGSTTCGCERSRWPGFGSVASRPPGAFGILSPAGRFSLIFASSTSSLRDSSLSVGSGAVTPGWNGPVHERHSWGRFFGGRAW